MKKATETALKGRARQLLEAMTDRALWTYAVPADGDPAHVVKILIDNGFVEFGGRFGSAGAWVELIDRPDLDVRLLRGSGAAAAPVLAEILAATGFYAQTTLLATAADLADPEAATALATLVEMAVVFDAGFRELVEAHLASEDEAIRGAAVASCRTLADRTGAGAAIDELIR